MRNLLLLLKISLFLISCANVPEIKDFNSDNWKMDEFGCKGLRNNLADILEEQRHSLKGVQEKDLINLLGQPNSIQIMERKQKYFSYWISNPSYCKDIGEFKIIKIRISALNQVTEVLF